jgi:hypothetical protein
MKHLLLPVLCLVFCATFATPALAATNAELQKQIESLQAQIKILNGSSSAVPGVVATTTADPKFTPFNDGKNGKPKIVLTAPTSKNSKFSKSSPTDPIVIKWNATNVPSNTNLTIDMRNVKVAGPVGGGTYQFAIPASDSKGEYKLEIYGEGRPSAGTYRIQLGLEECSSKGCGYNAHFPGQEEDVELYAQSRSVGVTVTGSSPKSAPTKAATVSTIDDTDTPNPTVTGTAKSGVTSVGFSIGQGDKIYGSGPIAVTNGRWSHTISEDLADGKYTLTLYVNNVVADEKKFTVK